jgi:hypothetical protein
VNLPSTAWVFLPVLLLVGCQRRVAPPYTGVLGYWTAEARARATVWRCEPPDPEGVRTCRGLVADSSYWVRSDSSGTVLEVRKRWRVPPGRLLRHLQILAQGFNQGRPSHECGSGQNRRDVWPASGYFTELSPASDSAGYLLVADTGLYSRSVRDTLPCPAA